MATFLTVTVLVALSWFAFSLLLGAIGPNPNSLGDIPKGGIPRVGRPCGFDQ